MLRRFYDAEDGVVTVTIAVSLVAVVAAIGAAIDFSRASNARSNLQAALDTAVLAGLRENGVSDARRQAATAVFEANLNQQCDGQSEITVSEREISATASCDVETSIMGIVGVQALNVQAQSRAEFVATGAPSVVGTCFYTLAPNGNGLLKNGVGTLLVPNCGIQVNSTSSSALLFNGLGGVNSPNVCIVGDAVCNGGTCRILNTGCAAKDDPLDTFTAPATGSCDFVNYSAFGFGSRTLNPGVYCGGISFNGFGSLTLNPGVYVIRNGDFRHNGFGGLFGDGVVIRFEGNSRMLKNGVGPIELSAPTSGPYAGFIFYEAPGATPDVQHLLNGLSNVRLEGTVYLPNQNVSTNGITDERNLAPWTIIVVNRWSYNGLGDVFVGSNFQGSPVPLPSSFELDPSEVIALTN